MAAEGNGETTSKHKEGLPAVARTVQDISEKEMEVRTVDIEALRPAAIEARFASNAFDLPPCVPIASSSSSASSRGDDRRQEVIDDRPMVIDHNESNGGGGEKAAAREQADDSGAIESLLADAERIESLLADAAEEPCAVSSQAADAAMEVLAAKILEAEAKTGEGTAGAVMEAPAAAEAGPAELRPCPLMAAACAAAAAARVVVHHASREVATQLAREWLAATRRLAGRHPAAGAAASAQPPSTVAAAAIATAPTAAAADASACHPEGPPLKGGKGPLPGLPLRDKGPLPKPPLDGKGSLLKGGKGSNLEGPAQLLTVFPRNGIDGTSLKGLLKNAQDKILLQPPDPGVARDACEAVARHAGGPLPTKWAGRLLRTLAQVRWPLGAKDDGDRAVRALATPQALADVSDRGLTALHVAVCCTPDRLRSGAADGGADGELPWIAVEALLDAGASTIAEDHAGLVPVHHVVTRTAMYPDFPARFARPTIIRLAQGGACNKQDPQGRSPLHHAALVRSWRLAEALLEAGALPELPTCDQLSALHIAVHGAPAPGQPDAAVDECGVPCSVRLLRTLGHGHPKALASVDRDHHTPLHWAVLQQKPRMATELIKLGASPVAAGPGWRYPLHIALKWACSPTSALPGHDWSEVAECIEHLCRKPGEALTLLDTEGLTPLHICVASGHFKLCHMLLDKGADAGQVAHNPSGFNPALQQSNDYAHPATLSRSALHQACLSPAFSPRDRALATAGQSVIARMMRHLLVLQQVDCLGMTPLHVACLGGCTHTTATLLDGILDMETPEEGIHGAAEGGGAAGRAESAEAAPPFIRSIFEARDQLGATPLFNAVAWSCTDHETSGESPHRGEPRGGPCEFLEPNQLMALATGRRPAPAPHGAPERGRRDGDGTTIWDYPLAAPRHGALSIEARGLTPLHRAVATVGMLQRPQDAPRAPADPLRAQDVRVITCAHLLIGAGASPAAASSEHGSTCISMDRRLGSTPADGEWSAADPDMVGKPQVASVLISRVGKGWVPLHAAVLLPAYYSDAMVRMPVIGLDRDAIESEGYEQPVSACLKQLATPEALAAKDSWGRTPLHWLAACTLARDHPETVDTLIRLGASRTARDQFGRTPADVARKRKMGELARRIERGGAAAPAPAPAPAPVPSAAAAAGARRPGDAAAGDAGASPLEELLKEDQEAQTRLEKDRRRKQQLKRQKGEQQRKLQAEKELRERQQQEERALVDAGRREFAKLLGREEAGRATAAREAREGRNALAADEVEERKSAARAARLRAHEARGVLLDLALTEERMRGEVQRLQLIKWNGHVRELGAALGVAPSGDGRSEVSRPLSPTAAAAAESPDMDEGWMAAAAAAAAGRAREADSGHRARLAGLQQRKAERAVILARLKERRDGLQRRLKEVKEDEAKCHDWPVDISHLSQLDLRELRDAVKHYQEQLREVIEDANLCVVCMTNQKSAVFLPCEHCCACRTCTSSLTQCPVCREHIDRNFFPR